MREPTYFVLASLLDGPGHGYAIIQRTTELSQGRVTIAVGTLYGALDRLVNDELVRVHSEEVVDGRFRRSYELTDAGRSALKKRPACLAPLKRCSLTPQCPRQSLASVSLHAGSSPHEHHTRTQLSTTSPILSARLSKASGTRTHCNTRRLDSTK
jgi:PadR family transcriptional regulator, regulatory protein PadR